MLYRATTLDMLARAVTAIEVCLAVVLRDEVCAVRTPLRRYNRLTSTIGGSPALFRVARRAAQRW